MKILVFSLCIFTSTNGFTLQDPARFLKRKLDSKLDVNPYFITMLDRKEYNQHYTCSYQEGPYCSLLSNTTYEVVEDNFISDNLRNHIKQKMYEQNKLVESEALKQQSFLPTLYYLDKSRAVIDEELFYKPIESKYPYRLLIDFNALENVDDLKNQELTATYLVNLNTGQQAVATTKPTNAQDFLLLSFTNFFFQFPKKQSLASSTQYIDRIDELSAKPSDGYIISQLKEGRIDFNVKVQIMSFYAKPNPTSLEKVQQITGKLYDEKQKLIADIKFPVKGQPNQFSRYTFEKNYTISSIVFSSYTVVDNMVVYIDKKNVNQIAQIYFIEQESQTSLDVQEMLNSFEENTQILTEAFSTSTQQNDNRNEQSGSSLKPRKTRITPEERKRQIQQFKLEKNSYKTTNSKNRNQNKQKR